jgi:asparagine synthase (glutamine-hydrolysing)
VLASEESALLRHPAVSSRLDDGSVARFFAARAPAPEATFFTDIKTLPPGHAMTVGSDQVRRWCYRQVTGQAPCSCSDQEWTEQMREVLKECVCCRLRSTTTPAVLMSGGLDSTSVAALAARHLQETGAERRLVTISWVFDETERADERQYIETMISHCRLDGQLIRGDDGWPLAQLETWPTNPNLPNQALYRRLTDRAYSAAHQAGVRVMLTGEYGDHLYFGWLYWLRDLLRAGRIADAWRLIRIELGDQNLPLMLRCIDLLRAAARVLGWHGRRPKAPSWLTRFALDLVGPDLDTEIGALGKLRRDQARALLDPYNAHSVCLESANASRAGIEVRTPYRDRRLVELALAMPAHLLYRRGWHKWIIREAMRGILPEPVRTRWQETSLAALCMRGLVEREQSSVARILDSDDAIWPQYVRADWLRHTLADQLRISGVAAVVIWSCICMELWRRELR